ncbi:MAG: cytochrome b/b6 domain-containing protein [candidate division Zixibacteria bacterium]|nr:cytochrome b/b6 domain-containing protein [candidate division Zixibacteria bacterium]
MNAGKSVCTDCHSDRSTFSDLGTRADSLVVTEDSLSLSAHAGLECTSCHTDLAGVADFPHASPPAKVNCGSCHTDAAAAFQWHGHLKVGVGQDIPTCADCHGTHDIRPSSDNQSRVNPLNLPQTCGRCHENLDLVRKHQIPLEKPVELFKSSIHGRASLGGIHLAATCNDCHSTGGTAHSILSAGNVLSSINHYNIPKTCGRCHSNVEHDYWEGVHGKLTAQGEADSPVCTDCHGEHGILSPSDPRSPVSRTRVAEATCTPCHESARLNEKYGVPTGQLKTWVDSYHGLKSRTGDVTVANCASCHGAHRILPHTDPTSSIYPDNLQKTCGHCHPAISAAAARAPIHGEPGVSRTVAARVVQRIYILAIIVIIGAMVVHWLLDLRKQIHLVNLKKQIVRMTLNEMWQHVFLMTTFIVLVITGFALRFSEAWWVRLMFGWEGGFPVRGVVHRTAAVLFILTVIWHVGYLTTARGRRFAVDIRPRVRDFTQFRQMVAYNLNLQTDRPAFGRFSYVEKAEYWALVWGTVLMIVSGLFMWQESLAVKWFPRGFLDVMLVIHYYEAWLATLAIAIWHLYSTVFSPGVYPMNPSWFTGKMPWDVYRHEHPADQPPSDSGIPTLLTPTDGGPSPDEAAGRGPASDATGE